MTAYHPQVRSAAAPTPRHGGTANAHLAPVSAEPAAAFTLEDAYYLLFRHKGKILLCTAAGLMAMGLFLVFQRPAYTSVAKLFIRYVVVEGHAVRPAGDDTTTKSPDRGGETILSSEQEILTSHDLARNVAKAVGPARILADDGGGDDLERAAAAITRGIGVTAPKSSSVLAVTFQHRDATLVQPVLQATLDQYLRMHVEVHRSAGMVGDYLAQETDQLRTRLAQTEEELRKARAKAGILAPEDARRAVAEQANLLRQQLFAARADYTQREQQLRELTQAAVVAAPEAAGAGDEAERTERVTTAPLLDLYRQSLEQAETLRRRERELQAFFTRDSPRVMALQSQRAEAEAAVQRLEGAHPELLAAPRPSTPSSVLSMGNERALTLERERAALKGLEAKIEVLGTQLEAVRTESARLDAAEGSIQELARRKDLEESNYRRYAASLEQSRINEAFRGGTSVQHQRDPGPLTCHPRTGKVGAHRGRIGRRRAGGGLDVGAADRARAGSIGASTARARTDHAGTAVPRAAGARHGKAVECTGNGFGPVF
jgi:uncharacterized protein involved in exopolysaccharide biosynthesis